MSFRWSASALKLGMDCNLALYYEKVMGLKSNFTLGYLATGTFLHKRMEKFYDKFGKPVYRSAESFANAAKGMWLHEVVGTGEIEGKKIKWSSEREPYIRANQIHDSCMHVYSGYAINEPALFRERKIRFSLNYRTYSGKVDEVRRGYIIRDHKHSDLDEGLPWNIVRFLADIQPTIYVTWFSLAAHRSKRFRLEVGVSEEDAKQLENDPLYLMEKVPFQFHDLKNGTIKEIRRTREDIPGLEAIVDEMEYRMINKKITANTSRCRDCKFNDQCKDLIDMVMKSTSLDITQLELFEPNPRMDMIKNFKLAEPVKIKRQVQFRLKFDK